MTTYCGAWMNNGRLGCLMGTKISDEQIGAFDRRLFAFRDKVVNGSRPYDDSMYSVQEMIEGRFLEPESIFVTDVKLQFDRWEELGVEISNRQRYSIMGQAADFVPTRTDERLLVSGGFGYNLQEALPRLWDAISQEVFAYKFDSDEVIGSQKTRYAPDMNISKRRGLRLVSFCPWEHVSASVDMATQRSRTLGERLAGIEVFEMAALDPEWTLDVSDRKMPVFNIAGLRVEATRYSIDREHAPVMLGLPRDTKINLDPIRTDRNTSGYSSPVIIDL